MQLFLALKNTIKKEYGDNWSICIYSGKRNGSGKSDHNTGNAIDIAITDKYGNLTGRKEEMAIVFDILLSSYSGYIKQLIWENKSINSTRADAPDNCVHFSVHNSSDKSFNVFQSYKSDGIFKTLRSVNAMSDTFLYCIAKKYNNSKYTNDDIAGIVYSIDKSSDVKNQKELLSKYYGEYSDKGITTNGDSSESESGSENENYSSLIMINNVKNCPNKNDFYSSVKSIANAYGFDPDWLMLFMNSESGLNPQKSNSIGAVGLIQFTTYTAQGLGTTRQELLGMNANGQMEYVSKFFGQYGSSLNGKIKNIVDLKLYGFAPSKLINGNFTSKDSVVYEVGSEGWENNYKEFTNGEMRDIIVDDVQRVFFKNIKSSASQYGFSDNLGKYLVGY